MRTSTNEDTVRIMVIDSGSWSLFTASGVSVKVGRSGSGPCPTSWDLVLFVVRMSHVGGREKKVLVGGKTHSRDLPGGLSRLAIPKEMTDDL